MIFPYCWCPKCREWEELRHVTEGRHDLCGCEVLDYCPDEEGYEEEDDEA